MTFAQLKKSKTIDVNVAAGVIIGACSFFGYTPPAEAVTAFFVVANFILRLVTKGPISEK